MGNLFTRKYATINYYHSNIPEIKENIGKKRIIVNAIEYTCIHNSSVNVYYCSNCQRIEDSHTLSLLTIDEAHKDLNKKRVYLTNIEIYDLLPNQDPIQLVVDTTQQNINCVDVDMIQIGSIEGRSHHMHITFLAK